MSSFIQFASTEPGVRKFSKKYERSSSRQSRKHQPANFALRPTPTRATSGVVCYSSACGSARLSAEPLCDEANTGDRDLPKATTCLLGDRQIEISEALRITQPEVRKRFRCLECGERVRAHKEGTTQQAAHFEHMHANPQCTRSTG
jgi:hypothetical protein